MQKCDETIIERTSYTFNNCRADNRLVQARSVHWGPGGQAPPLQNVRPPEYIMKLSKIEIKK